VPPKADPYSTKAQVGVDLILIGITALVMVIVIYTSPRHHATETQLPQHPETAQIVSR
jgi:hypothetical protein